MRGALLASGLRAFGGPGGGFPRRRRAGRGACGASDAAPPHPRRPFPQMFQARCARAPDQCLRYCFEPGAAPLWPSKARRPKPGDIPDCLGCGRPRRFEFQVRPGAEVRGAPRGGAGARGGAERGAGLARAAAARGRGSRPARPPGRSLLLPARFFAR